MAELLKNLFSKDLQERRNTRWKVGVFATLSTVAMYAAYDAVSSVSSEVSSDLGFGTSVIHDPNGKDRLVELGSGNFRFKVGPYGDRKLEVLPDTSLFNHPSEPRSDIISDLNTAVTDEARQAFCFPAGPLRPASPHELAQDTPQTVASTGAPEQASSPEQNVFILDLNDPPDEVKKDNPDLSSTETLARQCFNGIKAAHNIS